MWTDTTNTSSRLYRKVVDYPWMRWKLWRKAGSGLGNRPKPMAWWMSWEVSIEQFLMRNENILVVKQLWKPGPSQNPYTSGS